MTEYERYKHHPRATVLAGGVIEVPIDATGDEIPLLTSPAPFFCRTRMCRWTGPYRPACPVCGERVEQFPF